MSVSEALKLRSEFEKGQRNDHCFNAFNLLRLRICNEPVSSFHSLEEVLLREFYESGRLDYSMLKREPLHQTYQEIKVYVCSQAKKAMLVSDYRRKVGELITDLALSIKLESWFDFRFVLTYDEKERVLDQD